LLEQLKNLIRLQLLEDRKNSLLHSTRETPHRIAELEKEFSRFEQEYQAKKGEYDHARQMRRSLENDLADLEAKISRNKQRANEVKTNKEYQALLKEREEMQKESTRKEDQLLEIMDSLDSMRQEVERLAGEVEEKKKDLEANKEALQAQSEQVDSQVARLESMQQEIYDKLDPQLSKRCQSLMDRGSRVAVAPVQQGICQICHMSIPPQKFIELQRDDAIMHCPSCHRFIYWADHEAYASIEEELEEI
jgi:hypothetical protein